MYLKCFKQCHIYEAWHPREADSDCSAIQHYWYMNLLSKRHCTRVGFQGFFLLYWRFIPIDFLNSNSWLETVVTNLKSRSQSSWNGKRESISKEKIMRWSGNSKVPRIYLKKYGSHFWLIFDPCWPVQLVQNYYPVYWGWQLNKVADRGQQVRMASPIPRDV